VKRKPNILWIVADHQVHATRPPGFDDFPLQRKLAQLGTEFTRAYSVLPICSPARASMLTGLYPHAHGLTENDGRFGGREGLEPDEWMIHHPLREVGYRCGWFGKWHVDNRHSALDYGFEGFSLAGYGYPYASEAYREYLRRKGLQDPLAEVLIRNESKLSEGSEINLIEDTAWYECVSGVARLKGPVAAHEAYFVTDLASQWLDAVGDEPCFLRVDPWGPHPPYLLGDTFLGMLDESDIQLPPNFHSDLRQRPDHHGKYRDYWHRTVGLDEEQWRKQYQHALEHVILVETALAELLEHVDLDNTLVIFNSDHGDAVGSNGGVANKGDLMVEATMQIPLLMAGRDIPAGRTCNRLVSNLDLAPTLLELCGLDSGREFHGASLAGLLSGQGSRWRRGLMTQHYGLQEPVVQRAWYRDDSKLIVREDGFRELYDLARDPGELQNLALEPHHRRDLKSMEQELLSAMRAAGDDDEPVLEASSQA
jgi:arylsulfatase A-like enzyme